LDQISKRLQGDGLPPEANAEERQRHLWQQLLGAEAKLQSVSTELQTLRTQQANEMKEVRQPSVESYVAHIRTLLEERECLTAEYERDNEDLRHELHQIKHQQEIQSKEMAEMLSQEDLGEIGLSSPSEQVAYLLVERATLLERLEAAEGKLESHTLAVNTNNSDHRACSDNGSQSDMHDSHCSMFCLRSDYQPSLLLFSFHADRLCLIVLQQAHSEEISRERTERQRLERDLEEASRRLAMAHQDIRRLNNELDAAKNNDQDPCGTLQTQAVWNQICYFYMMKLQRAKEQNDRLDAENRTLRERVHVIESEKKNLMDQVRELQRQLQRLRKEQEELEERNEELEALLGEAQNASKEERHRHEGEVEGLLRRERMALLEARLTEEKEWRKQLELDLTAAQAALKKDKEIGERELKKLRLEVSGLQTECQQGKTLIKSLTQVKGEKAVLEEKVCPTLCLLSAVASS
ncbi:hypothetical protein GOODEAATRI_015686, partial [Goodea atripinnis]